MKLLQALDSASPLRFKTVEVPVMARGVAVVDFGWSGRSDVRLQVAAPTIAADSVVVASLAAVATSDHSADEHMVEEIDVRAGAVVAGVGFSLYVRTRNVGQFGRYAVAWMWS